ncbi:MAG: ATP-binding cassette domain-containing protein [Chloroflexi bacterium]|nr:ATP-binding cassette domain-containing protein [Chloroflexota bacterium]
MDENLLISVKDLKVYFKTRKSSYLLEGSNYIKAIDGISFDISRGTAFGIVGESGSGKTVLLRSLVRIIKPTSGKINAFNKDILNLKQDELKDVRRRIQLVFQNPSTSLHPRMTIEEICSEPLIIHNIGDKKCRKEKIAQTIKLVGLNPDHLKRYPHQFSGGQRQRIGLARALVLQPDVLLCDEPVSALDVSIRAQVLNLFQDLQTELNLTYLIIAHDLSAVRYLCSHVAIIYLGKFVEMGTVQDLYFAPRHPYTEVLIASVPTIEKSLSGVMVSSLPGDLPNPHHPPTGCPFHPRCPLKQDICVTDIPKLKEVENNHWVACHLR